ncbi:MAG: ATP-binding protein [Clostridium sp.]|nr:MAG: ATP-binding protein [Clostridium sp.]
MAFNQNFKTILRTNYEDDEDFDMDDIIIHDTSIEIENEKLKYLLFDFEKKVAPNKYERVFKAIKLVKIKRVPKKDLGIGAWVEMQTGVITGFYQNQINYIQIFANICKPRKEGLIFAYGVQGVSGKNIEEAMHSADLQMASVERAITGTYHTLEYVDLTAYDARWIFQKLGCMEDMRIIRGIPSPKITAGRVSSNTFAALENKNSEEQNEEFLLGMDPYEYLFVLTATSIDPAVLSKWKEAQLKEQTYWASIKNGQKSMTFGISMPMVYAANMGASQGWGTSRGESFGHSTGSSYSESTGHSFSHSVGTSESFSNGITRGTTTGNSTSQSFGASNGESVSTGMSKSLGTSDSISHGVSQGTSTSHGESFSEGTSSSYGESFSTGTSSSHSVGTSQSTSVSHGTSSSHSSGTSTSHSSSSGYNVGSSSGTSSGVSHSSSSGVSAGGSIGAFGIGGNVGASYSNGVSSNSGASHGTSAGFSSSSSSGYGTSSSNSYGVSSSTGYSQGTSESYSTGTSTSHGTSYSQGTSTSHGTSISQGTSTSNSTSMSSGLSTSVGSSNSYGQNSGTSASAGVGTSMSNSYSESSSHSTGTSESFSNGTSESVSRGTTEGYSEGSSVGSSTSNSITQGSSGSMGLGPSLSFGRTMAWEDREVTYLLDMLTYSTNRIIMGSNSLGMWFVDIYIAVEDEKAAMAAAALAMSAWHDKNALTTPLQVYKPSDKEKEYLMKHLSVFSPSVIKEGIPGQFESYKYSSMLLSNEIAAYSHPPRVNVGGIQAAIDDPPVLTISNARQDGDVFLGYVADVEKFDKKRGYKSGFRYCLTSDELHHAYISGASRSGKTVAGTRLVAEAYTHVRRGEDNKRLRFLIMDPKQDWRALAKVIPPGHFRFYSLSDPLFHPIKLNLMKIPRGVYTERYADRLREIFIRSYGLGDRGFQILGQAIQKVYTKAGCYDDDIMYNVKDPVTGLYPASERSKNITLADVCVELKNQTQEAGLPRDKVEAIQRIVDRMEQFSEPKSSIYKVFCTKGPDGMGIDDLLGADDVIVLESFGMDTKTSAFIFGLITSSVFQYAVSNGGFVKPKDQYETILVIEEANQVLIGEDKDNLGGANPFEIILDQSAGYGLFIWTLTQKIADMPRSVLANSALKIIGRQDDKDDIERTIVQIGKDGLIADRVFKNWLPDQPIGWFIIKSSRNRDFTMNAPMHVLIEYLDVTPPSNEELEHILEEGAIMHNLEESDEEDGGALDF